MLKFARHSAVYTLSWRVGINCAQRTIQVGAQTLLASNRVHGSWLFLAAHEDFRSILASLPELSFYDFKETPNTPETQDIEFSLAISYRPGCVFRAF